MTFEQWIKEKRKIYPEFGKDINFEFIKHVWLSGFNCAIDLEQKTLKKKDDYTDN